MAGNSITKNEFAISDREFFLFSELIYKQAGIALPITKRALIIGRLTKRLRHYKLDNFYAYYRLIHDQKDGSEMQMVVDLLTTNETYFFREPKHFEFLRGLAGQRKSYEPLNVWSAACSSGEEPYSVAMVLADEIGMTSNWQILATDLNQQMLRHAERGLYTISEAENIPKDYLHQYCLKGVGPHDQQFLIDKPLKGKIAFQQLNLNGSWHDIGPFDLIFLRNVMIYFDKQTREKLVERIANYLVPEGYLFISHSESLSGLSERFVLVRPAIYRLKERKP